MARYFGSVTYSSALSHSYNTIAIVRHKSWRTRCYSNTTVYYGIHKPSECIPVDSGVTNLIHDRRSCVDFTLEVEANVARCVHSSMNKPGVKRKVGYEAFTHCRLYCGDRG